MIFYTSIAGGFFVFSIILWALYAYGKQIDLVKNRIDGIINNSKHTTNVIDEELSKPLTERLLKPFFKSLAARFEKLRPKSGQKKKAGAQDDKLRKKLRQAGFSISTEEYTLLNILVVVGTAVSVGGLCLLLDLGAKSLFGAFFGLYTGYAVMRFYLTSAISKRRSAIDSQLPDVLDLLSVNVEAGLGFNQALQHVIGHFEGPLIDELTVTYREMTMGRTRREALTLFAERCDLSEIKSFTGAVIQAEELGISMKNILRTQAASIRTNRRNQVEEKAMKISVKIILPMVGLIFPVLLIVLMGPAAMKIAQQFMG